MSFAYLANQMRLTSLNRAIKFLLGITDYPREERELALVNILLVSHHVYFVTGAVLIKPLKEMLYWMPHTYMDDVSASGL